MKRPGSLICSSRKRSSVVRSSRKRSSLIRSSRKRSSVVHAVVRTELDLTRLVAGRARETVDDLESGPHQSGVVDAVRAGAGMPRAPEIVDVTGRIGGVPRPHQLLRGLRFPVPGVQRQTATAEGITGAAGAWTV